MDTDNSPLTHRGALCCAFTLPSAGGPPPPPPPPKKGGKLPSHLPLSLVSIYGDKDPGLTCSPVPTFQIVIKYSRS